MNHEIRLLNHEIRLLNHEIQVYVQHKMLENGEELAEIFLEHNGKP